MKDLFKILIAEKGSSISTGCYSYQSMVKELLKIYYDSVGILCVYNYSIECCALGLLELGYPYDLIVLSQDQQELFRAAKTLKNRPWIIMTRPRIYDLDEHENNHNSWERNVLHLTEWTNFEEFISAYDPKMGGIYRNEMRKKDPEKDLLKAC